MKKDYQKNFYDCPVCGSNDYLVKIKPTKEILDPKLLYGAASGIMGTQYIVECKGCTVLYENPRFDDNVILQSYMQSDETGHDSQFHMRVRSFVKALKRNQKHIPPPGAKVLDIGTAGGAFLDAAALHGYDVWGLEPSAHLVEKGKKRGLKILQGTIEDNNFEKGSFDMVCLWDVIEHLTNPAESLKIIKKLLKPDGVLLINYPDISTFQAKIFGKHFWWLISVHITHFSPNTIREICERTGYDAFSFKPYYQTLELGYLADMAVHLNVPLAKFGRTLLPKFLARVAVPYYASQTTSIARVK